ncbi:ribonuclease domain-containing protein [uncultured Jatrophihabitans sp.]|uniref:ribonuclease domain-containing protein n=1 Tax=uncultured Jatrophihabitans sp. TaxID=1610747 RepID=UPI0035CCA2CA
MRSVRRARRPLVALVALVAALAVGYAVHAGSSGQPAIHTVRLSSLPPQVATTVDLIRQGGPFPYPRDDGVVFHNDEHRLPGERAGYYHEYTVPTPGSPDRGARRIITGAGGQFYWTADHYETFERVKVDG